MVGGGPAWGLVGVLLALAVASSLPAARAAPAPSADLGPLGNGNATVMSLPPYYNPNGTNSTAGGANITSITQNPLDPGTGQVTGPPSTPANPTMPSVDQGSLGGPGGGAEVPSTPTPRVAVPSAAASAWLGLLLVASALGFGPPRYLLQFLPLFSRLHQDQMLEHEVRRSIVRYVEAHPGVHYSALRRALALPNGTLSFHLRSLEKTGYLQSRRVGIRLHFFAYGHVPELSPEDLLLPPRSDLLTYLRGHPGANQREIGRDLNLLPSRVNYHIRALTSQSLVQVVRQGRTTRCFALAAPLRATLPPSRSPGDGGRHGPEPQELDDPPPGGS